MPNSIPKKIHFFWTGSPLPETEASNLMSFLNYLPNKNWQVYLWLTHFDSLYKSSYFKNLDKDRFPAALRIKNINLLLTDEVIQDLAMAFPVENSLFPIKEIRKIIYRECIGLGNPAAAKDGLAPLILFVEGGYFLDFDGKAYKTLRPPAEAPQGFLVFEQGKIISALAATARHPFCALSLSFLVHNYRMLPRTVRKETGQFTNHPSPLFFDSQFLRDRHNVHRTDLTIQTSGSTIFQAYNEYCRAGFRENTNFLTLKNRPNRLRMGIELNLEQEGNWRLPKKFRSFDDEAFDYSPQTGQLEDIKLAHQEPQEEFKKIPKPHLSFLQESKISFFMLEAIEEGDLALIQLALKKGYKVTTPMIITALKTQSFELLKLVIQQNPLFINHKQRNSKTLISLLIKAKPINNSYLTPMASFLIKEGANLTPFLFYVALDRRHLPLAKELVQLDPGVVNCTLDAWRTAPLNYAVEQGLEDFIIFLLEHKANLLGNPHYIGRIPLKAALVSNHVSIFKILLAQYGKQDLDFNQDSKNPEMTTLDLALYLKRGEIISILKSQGAITNEEVEPQAQMIP